MLPKETYYSQITANTLLLTYHSSAEEEKFIFSVRKKQLLTEHILWKINLHVCNTLSLNTYQNTHQVLLPPNISIKHGNHRPILRVRQSLTYFRQLQIPENSLAGTQTLCCIFISCKKLRERHYLGHFLPSCCTIFVMTADRHHLFPLCTKGEKRERMHWWTVGRTRLLVAARETGILIFCFYLRDRQRSRGGNKQ